MTSPTRTPPGWPGDDPTVPEELGALGRRRARPARPVPRRPVGRRRQPVPEEELAAEVVAEPEPQPAPAPALDDTDPVATAARPGNADDLVAGVQPAGRVLVVMVAALVLAMLVNADALVERAERKPLGPERDRALAVWHPVQDVSHVLQLHRVRQLADWVAGNDDDDRAVSPVPEPAPETAGQPGRAELPTPGDAAASPAPDPPTAAGPPDLRTPSAAEPLRLWVGGDSMAEIFGRSLLTKAQATGLVDPTLHYEVSSGLVRPDFYNWPGALTADVEAGDPEVLVAFFGANDGQGIVLPDGTPVQQVSDPRWSAEYRRRVGAVMDQLRAGDRLVVWLGQPPMREPGFDGRMDLVNQAAMAEAATRPWIVFVDTTTLFGDPSGAFAELLPDAAGNPTDMRQGDGIHLTRAGGDRLAAHVMAVIGAHVDLSGAPRGDPG